MLACEKQLFVSDDFPLLVMFPFLVQVLIYFLSCLKNEESWEMPGAIVLLIPRTSTTLRPTLLQSRTSPVCLRVLLSVETSTGRHMTGCHGDLYKIKACKILQAPSSKLCGKSRQPNTELSRDSKLIMYLRTKCIGLSGGQPSVVTVVRASVWLLGRGSRVTR